MDIAILSLAIGLAVGLIVTIWGSSRVFTGANTKISRNPDGSVYRPASTIIGLFILWSLVFFVIAFIVISMIKWI